MTYSVALLAIPRVAWDYIAEAMEQSGYDNHMITTDAYGNPTVALNMEGISLIPLKDASDMCINSGNLSDLTTGLGEEAFRAGYEYAKANPDSSGYSSGWDRYEPSDNIMDLQNSL